MQISRNEWKFLITEGQTAELMNRFSGVLPFDGHHPEDGTYMIHSLYFDDLYDSCLKDNLAGNARRYKYRVRYYNNEAGELHLERKEKNLDRCGKHTCRLSQEEYEALCAGDVSAAEKRSGLRVRLSKDKEACWEAAVKAVDAYHAEQQTREKPEPENNEGHGIII